jgi:hypothetical protein
MKADRRCIRCCAIFTKPFYLRRHLARKTSCAPILEEADLSEEVLEDPDLAKKRCRFCGRVYSSYTSMRRHVRTSCRIAPNEKNGDAGMEVLYEHTVRRQEARIAALEAQNAEMLALMKQLAAPGGGASGVLGPGPSTATIQAGEVGIVATDHAVVAVDNSKKIVINVFGQEGLGHVTAERIRSILDEALRAAALPAAAAAAVLKTAMAVFSDSEYPENLTCFLPNKKTNDALVHAEGGWDVQPTQLVLALMAQTSTDVLFEKQPYENAAAYAALMKKLAENEARYAAGAELRPLLVRNKALLARALEALPAAGCP